jgi:hypothetical protein
LDSYSQPGTPELLFTENETNNYRLWGQPNASPYVKDAFHEYVIGGKKDAVNPAKVGTKAAAHYVLDIPAGGSKAVRLRWRAKPTSGRHPWAVMSLAATFRDWDKLLDAEALYAELVARYGEATCKSFDIATMELLQSESVKQTHKNTATLRR